MEWMVKIINLEYMNCFDVNVGYGVGFFFDVG